MVSLTVKEMQRISFSFFFKPIKLTKKNKDKTQSIKHVIMWELSWTASENIK